MLIKTWTYLFQFFFNDKCFPVMTDALSHDKATIFVNGICNVHISFLNASYNFSALQSLASISINLTNCVRLSNVFGSMYRTRKVIHLSLQISDVSSINIVNFVFLTQCVVHNTFRFNWTQNVCNNICTFFTHFHAL